MAKRLKQMIGHKASIGIQKAKDEGKSKDRTLTLEDVELVIENSKDLPFLIEKKQIET